MKMEEFTAIIEFTDKSILKTIMSGTNDSDVITRIKAIFGNKVKAIDIYKLQKVSRIEFQNVYYED